MLIFLFKKKRVFILSVLKLILDVFLTSALPFKNVSLCLQIVILWGKLSLLPCTYGVLSCWHVGMFSISCGLGFMKG